MTDAHLCADSSAPRRPLLAAEHLTKVYADGKVSALNDISLAIFPNDYVALMGASGSGKSTLLNMLGALDRPDQGEVYFEGRPLSRMVNLDSFRSRTIGFIFQSFLLLPPLSASENVQVPMFTTRRIGERARRALELLSLVGMSHRAGHRSGEFSVGERQRVAIARALANDPVLLLADEPTGNLDSRNTEEVLSLFNRLHGEHGKTLVVVTHSPEVASHARRIVTLRDGRVISDEPV